MNNHDILLQLKQDKESITELINKLSVPVLWQILQFFIVLELEYQGGEFDGRGESESEAFSNDLNYIVIEGPGNNKMEIWYKGRPGIVLPVFLSNYKEGRAIKDNGDIYYVDNGVYPNRIMKYVRAEIMANKNLAIIPQHVWDITIPQHLWDTTSPNVQDIVGTMSNVEDIALTNHSGLSRDGTKFMVITTLIADIHKIEQCEIRNMDTNEVILTRTTLTGNTKYYTSPRMNVIIETDTKLQYYLTTKNGTSPPININIPSIQELTSDVALDIYIQCNRISPQRKYNPEFKAIRKKAPYRKLIFSYDENKFIEVGHVSQTVSPLVKPLEVGIFDPRPQSIPDNQFLKYPNKSIDVRNLHYLVRILDVSGNVLVNYFVTHEEPVGISDTMFLTRVKRNEENNIITNKTVQNEYILVRSLKNMRGSIVQEIAMPLTVSPLAKPLEVGSGAPRPTSHVVEHQDDDVKGVIPGDQGSFMFLYGLSNDYLLIFNVFKFRAGKRYENMEQFLDDKLKD